MKYILVDNEFEIADLTDEMEALEQERAEQRELDRLYNKYDLVYNDYEIEE